LTFPECRREGRRLGVVFRATGNTEAKQERADQWELRREEEFGKMAKR